MPSRFPEQQSLHLADGDPRLVVVVVHHRGRAMLERCLTTLLASHDVELQVVVVFNACREAPPACLTSEPRLHAVHTRRPLGFGAANNLGVRWAQRHLEAPDYYLFLNDDTETEPAALVTLVAGLDARPRGAVAGPRLMIADAEGVINSLGLLVTRDGWSADEGIGSSLQDYGPLPPTRPVLAVTGAALLIRRQAFEAVGGWREIFGYYFEDLDLCLRVRGTGREIINVPGAVIHHRVSGTMSTAAPRKRFLFFRNRVLLIVLHWPWRLIGPMLRRTLSGKRRRRRRQLVPLKMRPPVWRVWLGVLLRLPAALLLRWRDRPSADWLEELREPGSLPQVKLPPTPLSEPVTPVPVSTRT